MNDLLERREWLLELTAKEEGAIKNISLKNLSVTH
jgi:hypothetical protein